MERFTWIDIFKGIGIISVVMSHIYDGEVTRMIYIFHMPLFFFISGYLSKPTLEYKSFFIKKTRSLLVPYTSFLILIYIAFYGLPELNLKEIAIYFAKPIIGGRFLVGSLGVFWFVPCLFLTQQVMNYILTKFDKKSVGYIMIFSLLISYINSLLMPNFWLPWNANVVFASAPIYYIGSIYKKIKSDINDNILIVLCLFTIGVSYIYPENIYDMKIAKYGYPVITLISSIILILGVKHFSEYISSIKFIKVPFSELGKASMVIMFLHQPIQIIVKSHLLDDGLVRFSIAIALSYLVYLVFKKIKLTRILFLGYSAS